MSEVIPSTDINRNLYLTKIRNKINADIRKFHQVIEKLDNSGQVYSADDVIRFFSISTSKYLFFDFMHEVIIHLRELGKIRTPETYSTTLNSFRRFLKDREPSFDDIDSDMIRAYESYLKEKGVSPNTSSFYMRNLRAVYNRAVEKGLIEQNFPFKHVYTGIDKTQKRAIPLKTVKKIKDMDLTSHPAWDVARNMFMFSFYTRGMSFVDMAYLQKKNLNHGILSYRRCKTGQKLFIKWEKCMQKIIDKYASEHSPYLLPIIKPESSIEERKQYLNAAHKINRVLKAIGKQLKLSVPLTMYTARHTWASIARSKNIPISIISEGMGHTSERTTLIYLASLNSIAIDKANKIILDSLQDKSTDK